MHERLLSPIPRDRRALELSMDEVTILVEGPTRPLRATSRRGYYLLIGNI
jgi:hypothetical protein